MRRVVSVLAVALSLAGRLGAQTNLQVPTFRSGVDLVRIDAHVTVDGKPITGLTPADFEVTDNGVVQTIRTADSNGRVDIVLVLDVSGSVHGPGLNSLLDGVRAFLGQVKPGERVALITFNTSVTLRAPLTADLSVIRRSLDAIAAEGATSLNDAVFSALNLQEGEARTLVLLFSDGADNSSWLSGAQAIDAARRADIVVCPVVVGPASMPEPVPRSRRFLDTLARQTGGRVFGTASMSKLGASFLGVLTEFRSRYLLAYTPTGVARDDGWHRVAVRVRTQPAQVTAKEGYLAHSDR